MPAQPSKPGRTAKRRLSRRDYHALGAFRQALRKFLDFSAAQSRAHGLTPQQHQSLLAIHAHTGAEPMTVGELAECMFIRNHSAVGLAQRLADKGLVTRETSKLDRRRVVLTLTPEGLRILESISKNNFGELNRMADIFRELLQTLNSLAADASLGGDGRHAKRTVT